MEAIGERAFEGSAPETVLFASGSKLEVLEEEVFNECDSLVSLTFASDGALRIIKSGAISDCGITSLALPASLTTLGNAAINDCKSLSSVTVAEGSLLSDIGWSLFSGCDHFSYNVYGNAYYLGNATHPYLILVSAMSYQVQEVEIHPTTTRIAEGAFRSRENLASVTFASGSQLISIGANAFENCFSLTSIMLPSGLTTIGGGAFHNSHLDSLLLPSSVTSIGEDAFTSTLLEVVYYGGTATDWSAIVIASGNAPLTQATRCLYSATEPTSAGDYWHFDGGEIVVWPEFEPKLAYTLKGDGTYEVSGIGTYVGTDVVIPAAYNGKAVTSVAAEAFLENETITSVSFPSSMTEIGTDAFSDCTALATLSFAGSSLFSIGGGAFYGCTALTEIILPEGLEEIGESAFCACEDLTTILLPSSVESIDEYAFDMTALTAVYYVGTASNKAATSISDDNAVLANATWYFYTDSQPTTAGNYWHYVNGERTIWVVILAPGTPVFTADDEKVTWANVSNATTYLVSTDGGSTWMEPNYREAYFSTETGEHTIKVKALNQTVEGEVATFSYRTTKPLLGEISTSGCTATWTATAKEVSLTVNGVSANYTLSGGTYSYTCAATEGDYTVRVSAAAGFDSANHIYYFGSDLSTSKTISVCPLSTPSISVTSYDMTWGNVSNASKYRVREDGGNWTETTSRTVALSSSTGNHTLEVQAISSAENYLASATATYSYETKALALSNLSVSKRKVTWTATALDSAITIAKNDVSQGTAATCSDVSYTSGTYTYGGVPRTQGSYAIKVTATKAYDSTNKIYYYASSSITNTATVTVSKLSTPSVTKGSASMTWSSITGASSYLSADDVSYSSASASYSATTGSHTFRVKAVAAADSAYVDSDYSTSVSYYTTPVSLSSVTFKGLKATWVASAKTVEVKEGSGSYAETSLSSYELTSLTNGSHTVYVRASGGYVSATNVYYGGSSVEKNASKTITRATTNLTFSDGAGSGNYVNDAWKQYNHGTGNSMTGQMNSRKDKDNNPIVNMVATSTYYRYVYKPTSGSIGVANYMTLRIGNYYDKSTDISYKILLKDTAGEFHYMIGTPNSAPVAAKTSASGVLDTFSFAFFDPVDVEEIWFLVYSYNESNTYSYLYVDDIYLYYVSPTTTTVSGGYSTSTAQTVTSSKSVSLGNKATVANHATFTLKNNNSSKQTVTITLYGQTVNGTASVVCQACYFLKASQSATTYHLAFNEVYVTSYKVEVVSSGTASVNVTAVSIKKDSSYENNASSMEAYRVESDSSNARSIKLFGEELVGKSSITLYGEAISRLAVFGSDISPLFTSIGGGVAMISATYASNTISLCYLYGGTKYTSSISVSSKTASNLMVNNQKDNVNYKISSDVQFSKNVDAHGIVFCGSSSMEKWVTFAMDMRGYNVADVGIGGTRSVDWISGGASLAERLIYPFNPSKVVLFVGVNDLKEGASAAATYGNLQTLFTEIHNHLPHATIYYVLINQVPNTAVSDTAVTTLNTNVTNYAADYDYLDVITIENVVKDGYNTAKPYASSFTDTMHLNQAGYTQWAYFIRKKILGL